MNSSFGSIWCGIKVFGKYPAVCNRFVINSEQNHRFGSCRFRLIICVSTMPSQSYPQPSSASAALNICSICATSRSSGIKSHAVASVMFLNLTMPSRGDADSHKSPITSSQWLYGPLVHRRTALSVQSPGAL